MEWSEAGKCHSIPWVTKLPKLRPTMQCQVGPFLSSNYGGRVSQRAGVRCFESHAYGPLDVVGNVLFTQCQHVVFLALGDLGDAEWDVEWDGPSQW